MAMALLEVSSLVEVEMEPVNSTALSAFSFFRSVASALPENLLTMKNLDIHPTPAESEALGVRPGTLAY